MELHHHYSLVDLDGQLHSSITAPLFVCLYEYIWANEIINSHRYWLCNHIDFSQNFFDKTCISNIWNEIYWNLPSVFSTKTTNFHQFNKFYLTKPFSFKVLELNCGLNRFFSNFRSQILGLSIICFIDVFTNRHDLGLWSSRIWRIFSPLCREQNFDYLLEFPWFQVQFQTESSLISISWTQPWIKILGGGENRYLYMEGMNGVTN